MLSTLTNLNELLSSAHHSEFKQGLLAAEALLDSDSFNKITYSKIDSLLKVAEAQVNKNIDKKDESYFYLLQGVTFALGSWIADDPKIDLQAEDSFNKAKKLNPELSDSIEKLVVFFELLEYEIEITEEQFDDTEDELDDTEDEIDNVEFILPGCIKNTIVTQRAIESVLRNQYDIANDALQMAYEHIKKIIDNTGGINPREPSKVITLVEAKRQLDIIDTILNQPDDEKKAIIRDQLANGDKHQDLYTLLEEGYQEISRHNLQGADKIYQECFKYLDIPTLDRVIKINILLSRAYIHAVLFILTPITYRTSQFISNHLFEKASKYADIGDNNQRIESMKQLIDFHQLVCDCLPESNDASYVKDLLDLPRILSSASKLIDNDTADLSDANTILILTRSKKFYFDAYHDKKNKYIHSAHLFAIDRLLGNNEAYFSGFLDFIFYCNYSSIEEIETGNLKDYSYLINTNLNYFLKHLSQENMFGLSDETNKKLDAISASTINLTCDHFYNLARDFKQETLTSLAVIMACVGVMLEKIQLNITNQEAMDTQLNPVTLLQNEPWDFSLYSHLNIAGIYINYLVGLTIKNEQQASDLNKEFKKIMSNIEFQDTKLLSKVKVKQCETFISSILNSKENIVITKDNLNGFKKILELLFVSKAFHYYGSQEMIEKKQRSTIHNDLIYLFPRLTSACNVFLNEDLASYTSQQPSNVSGPSHLPAQSNTTPNDVTSKTAKKKIKLPKKEMPKARPNSIHRKATPIENSFKDMPNYIPDNILSLMNTTSDSSEQKCEPTIPDKKETKNKKNNQKSRRKAAKLSILQSISENNDVEHSIITTVQDDTDVILSKVSNVSADVISEPVFQIEYIPDLSIMVPNQIKKLIILLKEIGSFRVALVGGYVRDQLLKYNVNKAVKELDYDIVIDLPINKIHDFFPELFKKKSFDDQLTLLEFEELKVDVKYSPHLDNPKLTDLQAYQLDARTRDFTCNVLYANEFGQVFDPLGIGVEGLKEDHLIVIPYIQQSESAVLLNQKDSILKSFNYDPIRIFRALHATNKRNLEFSDEMKVGLSITVKNAYTYFFDENNSGKINSWMHKLLCGEQSEKNFKSLLTYGLLNCLFPMLSDVYNNDVLASWIINELGFPSHKLSLNYIYAMFIFGSYILSNPICNSITDKIMENIHENIVDASPLLKKNFDARPLKVFLNYAKENYANYLLRLNCSAKVLECDSTDSQQHSASAPPPNTIAYSRHAFFCGFSELPKCSQRSVSSQNTPSNSF